MEANIKRLTLLEKAKAVKIRDSKVKFSVEEKELIIAWLNGEIGLTQIAVVKDITKRNTSQIYNWLALGARAVWEDLKRSQESPWRE